VPPLIAKIENMAFRIIIPVPEKQFAKTDYGTGTKLYIAFKQDRCCED